MSVRRNRLSKAIFSQASGSGRTARACADHYIENLQLKGTVTGTVEHLDGSGLTLKKIEKTIKDCKGGAIVLNDLDRTEQSEMNEILFAIKAAIDDSEGPVFILTGKQSTKNVLEKDQPLARRLLVYTLDGDDEEDIKEQLAIWADASTPPKKGSRTAKQPNAR